MPYTMKPQNRRLTSHSQLHLRSTTHIVDEQQEFLLIFLYKKVGFAVSNSSMAIPPYTGRVSATMRSHWVVFAPGRGRGSQAAKHLLSRFIRWTPLTKINQTVSEWYKAAGDLPSVH